MVMERGKLMLREVIATLCSPGSVIPETSTTTVVSPWFRRLHTSPRADSCKLTVCSAPSEIISPRSSSFSNPLNTTRTFRRVPVSTELGSLPT